MKEVAILILCAVSAPVTDQAPRIAQAFKAGDVTATASYLSSIASRDLEALGTLDQELQARGLPTGVELLIESRLSAAKNGQQRRLPRISLKEMSLIGSGMVDRIEEDLAQVRSDPIMKASPKSLAEFHDAFWALDAARNRFNELRATTAYWKEVTKRFPRRSIPKLPEAMQARVGAERAAKIDSHVSRLIEQVDDREIRFRLTRSMLAVKALRQQADLSQRILAAGYWREDYETLSRFLSARERPTIRNVRLDNRELLNLVENNAHECDRLAGGLTAKAEAMNQALFWWVRGRYGAGTAMFGLAKPTFGSRQDPAGHLIMPSERPLPTDAQTRQDQPVPTFPRRHHYSWAVGQREYSVALTPQIQNVPVLKGFR